MGKKPYSLLDRAIADADAINKLLPLATDELAVDVCAYHCQACLEKVVKYVIELEGKEYSVRHDMSIVIDDLENNELKELIEPVIMHIDRWISSTRYGKGIQSSSKHVQKVHDVCLKAIEIAKQITPPEIG